MNGGFYRKSQVPNKYLLIHYVETTEILKYIDDLDQKLELLNQKTKSAIEKLQEYRTVLISAAVTGKIKVGE